MSKRTEDQNALFHVWVREITTRLVESGVSISEAMVKEVMKHTVGNNVDVLGVNISMPTSKYRRGDEDLSQAEHDKGVLSFDGFLREIQAWSAREINLELTTPDEDEK